MSDVYRKDGVPDRLVDTEAERVAAVWEGFKKVEAADYIPQKGDVIVLQPPEGEEAGHIEMYNGTNWVSDFVQGERIYPGPAYRRDKVAYEIFRP